LLGQAADAFDRSVNGVTDTFDNAADGVTNTAKCLTDFFSHT
jgi:hypothetical protein